MKYQILLFVIFCAFHIGYYRPYVTFIDENASIFLANAIPADNESEYQGFLADRYYSISPQEIKNENKIGNVFEAVVRDGGNGQFYYFTAHYFSKLASPYFGVYNSLKLLSCIFSLIMVFSFFYFIRTLIGELGAFISALFLLSLAVRYNIFIRNYAISNMMVTLFFIQLYPFYFDKRGTEKITVKRKILFFVTTMLLPFSHFFNLFYLIIAGFPAGLMIVFKGEFRKYYGVVTTLTISLLFFLFYYYVLNNAGREYQSLLNKYWRTYSTMYGLGQNYWLTSWTFKYFLIENEELILRIFGLDLRDVIRSIRLIALLPIVSVPFFLIYQAYKSHKFPNNFSIPRSALAFVLICIFMYSVSLNLIYLISGHAISVNNQHYLSSVFVFSAFAVAYLFHVVQNPKWKFLLNAYIIIVVLNSGIGSFYIKNRNTSTEHLRTLLQKVENQYSY